MKPLKVKMSKLSGIERAGDLSAPEGGIGICPDERRCYLFIRCSLLLLWLEQVRWRAEELNFEKDNQKVISTKSKMSGVVIFSAPPLIGKAGQVRVRFTKSRRTTKVIRTKLGPFRWFLSLLLFSHLSWLFGYLTCNCWTFAEIYPQGLSLSFYQDKIKIKEA